MATIAKNKTAAIKSAKPAVKPTAVAEGGAPAAGNIHVLQVITKRDGFRRGGREWNGTATVPMSDLTQEQYEQITGEPMLVTLLLEVPDEAVADLAGADAAVSTTS